MISIMADASSPWADASCRRRGPLARCSRCAGCGDASREPASAGHRGSRTCQSGHFFPGTQDLSPPRSFQSLPAGGHGRALASSQRVTSSWLPLWTSRPPKSRRLASFEAAPAAMELVVESPPSPLSKAQRWRHSDHIMADASSPWADASCRRRGPLARCSRCAGCGDASREPASAGHRGSNVPYAFVCHSMPIESTMCQQRIPGSAHGAPPAVALQG